MFQGVSRNPNAMDLSGVNDVRARSFLLQHAHHYGLVMLLDDNPEKSCQCGGMGLKCGWKFLCVHTSRFMPLSVDKSWDSVRNKNHCAKCRRQLTPQIHYNSYITLIVKFFFWCSETRLTREGIQSFKQKRGPWGWYFNTNYWAWRLLMEGRHPVQHILESIFKRKRRRP